MRFYIILCVLILSANTLNAKDYYYFSNRNGQIIKTDGTTVELNYLTLMEWKWDFGSVVACYGRSKLKCKEIEIDMGSVKSIEFEKENENPDYVLFYAVVTLKTGTTDKILVKRVYNNGMNNPSYSFVGKNEFGTVEVKMWDVKHVEYQ
jgi:hypothetical protein